MQGCTKTLVDQKAPPGSGGAPHYYLPLRIFDPWCIPAMTGQGLLKWFFSDSWTGSRAPNCSGWYLPPPQIRLGLKFRQKLLPGALSPKTI